MGFPEEEPAEKQQEEPVGEVFPRIREKDPYRLLGVVKSSTFEEVQDARNYYYETYKHHEASREAIEWAFDSVLNDKMKSRQKYGFRPPKTGRKTDVEGDPKQGFLETLKGFIEPSVPKTTIVNEGFIYFMLACWAAGTQHATGDPTAPFVLAMGFCCWRMFDKRNKRNPDGPYFGNSPIWGAVGTALLGFIFALVTANSIVSIIPLPAKFSAGAVGAFLAMLVVGCTSIFIR